MFNLNTLIKINFYLGFTGIFAIFQLIVLPFCPESPRYLLITKEKLEEASHTLKWLRCRDNVSEELEELLNEAKMERSLPKVSSKVIYEN